MQDLVDLWIDAVVRDDFSEGVLPLPHAFTTHVELVGDFLAAFTICQGRQKRAKRCPAVPLDEVSCDTLATVCRCAAHGVLPWNIFWVQDDQ